MEISEPAGPVAPLSGQETPVDRNATAVGVTIILLALLFVYFPALRGGFVFDDDSFLTSNSLTLAPDGLFRFWFSAEARDYWPVTNSSFWFEWRLWGPNPIGYHVTNVILHFTASLLVWKILRKMRIPGAFGAAMLFAVHPVNVQSVAWISQRKNTLSMVFLLISVWCYLCIDEPPGENKPGQQGRPARTWHRRCFIAFVLAMLSKGSVAILPLILLLITRWQRALNKSDLLRITPFVIVAVLLTAVNIWFQTHGWSRRIRVASVPQQFLGAGAVIWFYLFKALVPVDLCFSYPLWKIDAGASVWWIPLIAAVAVTGALWHSRQTRGVSLLFAWTFHCVALLPVMGFVPVAYMAYSLVADQYQYISILGVIVWVSAAASCWCHRSTGIMRHAQQAIGVVSVGVLILLARRQSGTYAGPMELYLDTLRHNPASWMACNNIGGLLYQSGHLETAVRYFNQAIVLAPDYPNPEINLGNTLLSLRRTKDAIQHFQNALRRSPNYVPAIHAMAIGLLETGRIEEAVDYLQREVLLDPGSFDGQNKLSVALTKLGRIQEATDHLEKALRVRESPALLFDLAQLYARSDRGTDAIGAAERALSVAIHVNDDKLAGSISDWLRAYRESVGVIGR